MTVASSGATALMLAGALVLAGCVQMPAGPDSGQGGREAGWLVRPAPQAMEAVAVGDSREQVRERLGQAAEARFASGREVWLYRFGERDARRRDAAGVQELVILFDQSGRVERRRVRHADGSE